MLHISNEDLGCTVTKEEQIKEMYAEKMKDFGMLDILVNNAGISQAKDIFEMNLSDWEHVMNVNLTSAFICSKYAIQIMKEQNYGRVISIASQAGEWGSLFGYVHYVASKSCVLVS